MKRLKFRFNFIKVEIGGICLRAIARLFEKGHRLADIGPGIFNARRRALRCHAVDSIRRLCVIMVIKLQALRFYGVNARWAQPVQACPRIFGGRR
jgi:hypothetical protein